MKITSLLGAIAVLSIVMMPALSQPIMKSCSCMPKICQERPMGDCCGKSQDCRLSSICNCSGLESSYSGPDYFDPDGLGISRNGSRTYASAPKAPHGSGNFIAAEEIPPSSIAPACKNAGPPDPPAFDPDVVAYLPASARNVFLVLASDGPLTKKDIISRTDLPPRTVRYALDRLKGEDMLEERFCFRDARQSLYNLTGIEASR